ncbi:NAD-dependent epimerase/dehydratase family protein [Ancylobacter sp. VNQ12]|uniref:NAD-dependent epimerase/dehydratase family protein n=1 Tax=Ancylobacter sp. VNQ12 TaxID=3400920 RepID=UPI003C08910A
MTTLLCLGLGYCAQRFVARHGDTFSRIVGTSRSGTPHPRVEMMRFTVDASDDLIAAARTADVILASAAPGEAGDPFLGPLGAAIGGGSGKGPLVYLSTIGVYGDSGGSWIDETAPLASTAPRGRQRIAAEQAWQALGDASGRPVAVLRLGGIYGPGRNVLVDVADGSARCVERAGQVFNRIHVDDIADAIHAAGAAGFDGAVNLVDDEPSPSCAPVRFAAGLLGRPAPEAVPFAEAATRMSAMALSFWADNRRVRNDRLHALLGGPLRHPTYREGLAALFAAGEGVPAH